MLFTQTTFLTFFALVFLGNLATRFDNRANKVLLLLASWCFFAYWRLNDFTIMLCVLCVNYLIIRRIDDADAPAPRRRYLVLSATSSLAALAFFKYRSFFGENLATLLGLAGLEAGFAPAESGIPLGISFYTFQCLSFAIDVHDREYRAASFLDFATYISFFPQIIAGPIVRGNELVPQLEASPRERSPDWRGGTYWLLLGLFMKSVVADNIADAIDPLWVPGSTTTLSFAGYWLVAVLYAAQIFTDFAGYSFMAVGLGKLLGFELPENFDAPYLATSFRDFWRRWHVTLSRFLRDYLYVGLLGGNRGGFTRTLVNLNLTMLLGGLWHGAAWTFVAWGAIHGAALTLERLVGMDQDEAPRSPLALAGWWILVQFTVLVAWVLFRSPSFVFAYGFLKGMAGAGPPEGMIPPRVVQAVPLLVPVVLHHLARLLDPDRCWFTLPLMQGAIAGVLLYVIAIFPHAAKGFIYFTF